MGFVGRHEVFAWMGRKCILLPSGLLFFHIWGPDRRNLLVLFRTEYSLDWRRLVAVPCSDRVYVSSVHCNVNNNKARWNLLLCVFLVQIECNNSEGCGSNKLPTCEYSQGLGFQSHQTELVYHAWETNINGYSLLCSCLSHSFCSPTPWTKYIVFPIS
jgi:hypothetical protein